jgi:hypothetical protein
MALFRSPSTKLVHGHGHGHEARPRSPSTWTAIVDVDVAVDGLVNKAQAIRVCSPVRVRSARTMLTPRPPHKYRTKRAAT